MKVAGVDGCPGGWVAILLSEAVFDRARFFPTFAALMDEMARVAVVAVDMPLRLVEEGDREADKAARRYLKGQASSIFSSPPRSLLAVGDYDEAREVALSLTGKSISKQTFAIVPKIVEVREFIQDDRLHEVHPEISFRLLNRNERLLQGKKTWGGLKQRLSLLESAGVVLPDDLGDVNRVGIDDVVDAAAAAWSALRIGKGQARSFPERPSQRDSYGEAIAIWG